MILDKLESEYERSDLVKNIYSEELSIKDKKSFSFSLNPLNPSQSFRVTSSQVPHFTPPHYYLKRGKEKIKSKRNAESWLGNEMEWQRYQSSRSVL